ncbi:hypothetical protein ACIGZJ_06035 [Kitasatospora sp. NPDC052868]|uniref:hypothetical protein n=1 Tax=Kitasatospora sp. NPDC052868 TaxID=3364060 RepID=UPI0037C6AC1C
MTFRLGREGLDPFLATFGLTEAQLRPGVVGFISSELEMTGWSIDATHPMKGFMVPAKENDWKSPSRKITVDYSDPASLLVYVLAAKP